MENTFKISHTAFPDGTIIRYTDGMENNTNPEPLNIGNVIMNAVKENRKRATAVMNSKIEKQIARSMYAIK
jgi:hypothetical protein